MMCGKRFSVIGLLMLAILLAALFVAVPVYAALNPNSGGHQIGLTLRDGSIRGTELISARLTSGGNPVGDCPIDFFLEAGFFGSRQVVLGTAETDATGTASIVYKPQWDGMLTFIARCRGDVNQPPVETSQTIEFSGAVTPYTPPPVGLWPLRYLSTRILVGGVIGVWLLLGFIAVRTVRGIRRA